MEEYINISLIVSPFLSKILDLRVPTELTIKELLKSFRYLWYRG